MSRIALKARDYRIMGYIDTRPNGDKIAMTAGYKTLGYYRAKENVTLDTGYRVIARGDVLSALIQEAFG